MCQALEKRGGENDFPEMTEGGDTGKASQGLCMNHINHVRGVIRHTGMGWCGEAPRRRHRAGPE